MQHSTLTAPLILCGIISIILQAIGFFSPAWMIISEGVDTDKLDASSGTDIGASLNVAMEIRMGLWTTSACVDTGFGKFCETVSTTKLEETMGRMSTNNPAASKLIGDWIALQSLGVFAGISAIVGLTALFVFARASDDSKVLCHGGIVTVSWLISAILILAAVGKNANDQHTYSMGSDVVNSMDKGVSMKFALPWATVVSGIGGGFAVVVAIVMALYLMCRERRETPGVWMQFGGGKPI